MTAKSTPAVNRKRVKLPNPLPESKRERAMWIGYDASRFFPFDARLYLERMLIVGAPVTVQSDGWVAYGMPEERTPEYEFLNGWHNGFDRAVALVCELLEQDEDLRKRHKDLANTPRRERGAD